MEPRYREEAECLLDIGVANTLGILFRSGHNILRFYCLRETLLRLSGPERLGLLSQLKEIVLEERELSGRLKSLCESDPRLGFHADAEGFKFFPAKLEWREEQLDKLLAEDFPEFERAIDEGRLLFPEYTGHDPTGAVAHATPGTEPPAASELWQLLSHGSQTDKVKWAAGYGEGALQIYLCVFGEEKNSSPFASVHLKIEPRRLWPAKNMRFDLQNPLRGGAANVGFNEETGSWNARVDIPLSGAGQSAIKLHPLRLDVRVRLTNGETAAWRPNNALDPRLLLGGDNPADLGWLIFDKE